MSMPCTPAKYKPFLSGEKHKPALTRYQSILNGYLHFVTPATLGCLKKIRFKEPPVLGISKAFKETLGFMKELAKT
jgi:hypothetical protein